MDEPTSNEQPYKKQPGVVVKEPENTNFSRIIFLFPCIKFIQKNCPFISSKHKGYKVIIYQGCRTKACKGSSKAGHRIFIGVGLVSLSKVAPPLLRSVFQQNPKKAEVGSTLNRNILFQPRLTNLLTKTAYALRQFFCFQEGLFDYGDGFDGGQFI